MKTRLTLLPLLVVLCSMFATTAVFGQPFTRNWTNATSIDIGLGVNWDPNGQASGNSGGTGIGDTMQWDGIVPGNLALQYITALPATGFNTFGINMVLTANQAGDVVITAPAAGSPPVGILGLTNDSPTALLSLGQTGGTLNLATRPGVAGTIHGFVNNSAQPAVLGTKIGWVAGGGVACVMAFSGTGDWTVNHVLRDNNSGAGPVTVTWEGPGTMNWSPGGVFLASDPLGPIGIDGGTVILKGAGLALNFTGVAVGNNRITNNATLKFDAPGILDTIPRLISGSGLLEVVNGTLTLSGPNEYTGNTTLSGGELIVGSAENLGISGPLGVGGTISFAGGTLGFNAANTYDYSPRFSTAPGQAYKFDTHGLSALLTNDLTSSGGTLTKLGSGTLTLSGANTYGGTTIVGAGKLVLQNTAGTGGIIVSNSTILGVAQNGTKILPATLTVGTTGSATLEFNNVTSTAIEAIATGPISAGGPITVNVNGGSFAIGSDYPLISWTGAAPTFTLGTLTGAGGNLTIVGSTLYLHVTSLAYVWTGENNGNWVNTPSNWKVNGVATPWADGNTALFDDTATGETNVVVNAAVSPLGVTVNSSSKTYSITSSGANLIGGTGGLSKNGSSTLTLAGGVNTYSGATTLSGGTVSVGTLSNGGSPSDIGSAGSSAAGLVFNGGALQYTGSAADIDHLFTLGTGGGAIDSSGAGALVLNNAGAVAFSGTGARVLTLTGTGTDTNTLAAALADNGGATALTKNGAGTWVLTADNNHSGVTTIGGGTLQIGAGGATGSPGTGNIINNGSIAFNRSGTLTVGTITGSGFLTNDGSGTIILPGDNAYQGGTTINAGTLQIGNGGATGKIDANDPILNNGTFIVDSTGDLTLSGPITGSGQLIKRGSGLLKLLGTLTAYTGGTTIDAGARLQIWQGNTGGNTSPAITNNGTLIMMRQDNAVAILAGNISGSGKLQVEVSNGNAGDSTLTGTNTYTGGTYILGGGLVLGDNGITPEGGSIIGDVFLTNDYLHNTFGTPPNDFVPATLVFNRADDFTFPGTIVGNGFVEQRGSGIVTLTGNNTYTNTGNGANTTVTAGTLLINGTIGGSPVTVNGGTLGGTGTIGGSVNVTAAGTLAPGASIGTLTILGNLTIVGNLAIDVNKSQIPANDVTVVNGTLNNTGVGTLTVANLGPALAIGDKFTLFNKPVPGGAALIITGGGVNWANNLEVDGSISVTPPNLDYTQTGNNLDFTWDDASFGDYKLQSQINSLNVGLSSNWTDYPGGGTPPVSVPIDATKGAVFFRLVPAP